MHKLREAEFRRQLVTLCLTVAFVGFQHLFKLLIFNDFFLLPFSGTRREKQVLERRLGAHGLDINKEIPNHPVLPPKINHLAPKLQAKSPEIGLKPAHFLTNVTLDIVVVHMLERARRPKSDAVH